MNLAALFFRGRNSRGQTSRSVAIYAEAESPSLIEVNLSADNSVNTDQQRTADDQLSQPAVSAQASNAGRQLGELAAASRKRAALDHHQNVLAVARKMRAARGLPPHPGLQS